MKTFAMMCFYLFLGCAPRHFNRASTTQSTSIYWNGEWDRLFGSQVSYQRSEIGLRSLDSELSTRAESSEDWLRLKELKAVFPQLAQVEKPTPEALQKCREEKKGWDKLGCVANSHWQPEHSAS